MQRSDDGVMTFGPELLLCPRCLGGPLLALAQVGRGYCSRCGETSDTQPKPGGAVVRVVNVDREAGTITITGGEE